MPALTKRADGRFRVKYKDKYFYGSTSAEAKCKRDEYKAAQLFGVRYAPPVETVSSYVARWLPTAKAGVNKRVYNQYADLLERMVTAMGATPIDQVTPTDVKAVYNTMLTLSDSTVKKARTLYVAMFDAAVEDGLIRVNPARSKSAKPHKGTVGTHRILTDEEVRLIHQVDHRCRPFALTMYYAGLRRGEALALDIDRDIDFKSGWIHITQAVRYDANAPILDDPKTEAGRRDIPLLPQLAAVLKGRHGLLLPSSSGGLCTETAFSRAWESYNNALSRAANGGIQRRWYGRTREHKALLEKVNNCAAAQLSSQTRNQPSPKRSAASSAPSPTPATAGTPSPTPAAAGAHVSSSSGGQASAASALPPWREISLRCHDFRHSYCTNLCSAGVDLHVAICWLGHADEKMILQIYDHVTPARIRTAITQAAAFFRGQNGGQIYHITRKPSKISPPKPRHYTLRIKRP